MPPAAGGGKASRRAQTKTPHPPRRAFPAPLGAIKQARPKPAQSATRGTPPERSREAGGAQKRANKAAHGNDPPAAPPRREGEGRAAPPRGERGGRGGASTPPPDPPERRACSSRRETGAQRSEHRTTAHQITQAAYTCPVPPNPSPSRGIGHTRPARRAGSL